jgi:hypothetical protein
LGYRLSTLVFPPWKPSTSVEVFDCRQGKYPSDRFGSQALPGSVLKLDTSCQKKNAAKDPVIPPGYLDFGRKCTRARGAAARVLTVFVITCSIFGIFQLFLGLDISTDSNEATEYRHTIVGLTVWSGRSFLCFGNFISLTAVLPKLQLLRLAGSLAVLLVTIVL